jgi:hypothetical protein
MNVKAYFQKLRAAEQELPGDHVVVVSLRTADGAREGRVMELNRSLAAKMIVDRRVRLATENEIAEFRMQEAKEQEEANLRNTDPRTRFLVDLAEAQRRQ